MRLRSTLKRTVLMTALLAAAVIGATHAMADGQETFGPTTVWLPEDVSTTGHSVDLLFNLILYLTSVICVAVFIVMGVFLIKYRYKEGRHVKYVHGNNRLEIVWTLVPTLIMALIAAFSQSTWSQVKSQMPNGPDVIDVHVIGRQFVWYFHYAGADGKFGPREFTLMQPQSGEPDEQIGLDREHEDGKDDLVLTKMVVPVNTKVVCEITSIDVIHSFFLPNFRIKQDAMPGLRSNIWLEATKTGAQVIGSDPQFPLDIYDEDTGDDVIITDAKPFDIVCAELCGSNHFKMRGSLYVVTQSEYDRYMKIAQSNIALAAEDDEL